MMHHPPEPPINLDPARSLHPTFPPPVSRPYSSSSLAPLAASLAPAYPQQHPLQPSHPSLAPPALPHLALVDPSRPHSRSGSPYPDPSFHASAPAHARPNVLQGYAGVGNGTGNGMSMSGGGPRNAGPYGAPQAHDTRTQLFVSNLPFRVRWQDLKDLMRKCGTVLRADVALSPTDGRSRGFGVVLFARAEDAVKAIGTYHGYTWQTRVLDVRIDAQDPTGALALAEANRQQAIQQQREVIQNLQQRLSPAPPPPPPPPPVGMLGSALIAPYLNAGRSVTGSMHPRSSSQSPSPSRSPLDQAYPMQGNDSVADSRGSPYLSASSSASLDPSTSTAPSSEYLASPPPRPSSSASPYPPSHSESMTFDRSASTHGSPNPSNPLLPSQPNAHSSSHPHPLSRSSHGGDFADAASNASPRLGYQTDSVSSAVPPQLQIPPPQLLVQSRDGPAYPPPPQQSSYPPPGHDSRSASHNGLGTAIPPPVLGPGMTLHPMGYAVPAGPAMSLASGGGGPGPGPNGMGPPHPSGLYGAPGPRPNGGGGPSPGMGPGQGQYPNRHLFVGNLPFNCQWQELKDLMRGAGSVLRADIAQGPDGRSRGFGSVLFSNPIDAERAVQLFNGHEFQGRTLKVHFDKFAGAGVNPPNGLAPHVGANGVFRTSEPPPPPPYPHQSQQLASQYGPLRPGDGSRMAQMPHQHPFQQQSEHQLLAQHAQYQQRHQYQQQQVGGGGIGAGPSLFAHSLAGDGGVGDQPGIGRDSSSRPGTAQAPIGSPSPSVQARQTASHEEQEVDSSGTDRDEHENKPATMDDPSTKTASGTPAPPSTSTTSPSNTRHNPSAPSRIAMPPPLPFSSVTGGHVAPGGNGLPTAGGGPFSPLHSRLPPMTPSMPAFTFGGFNAQTPPVHPHALFSPGVGPFSPQMGSPFFGPGQGMNHFQTVAPGAPSPGFGFNPMFPTFPSTPNGHPNTAHPIYPINGADVGHGHHRMSVGAPSGPMHAAAGANANGGDHPTPQATVPSGAAEASYFPPVEKVAAPRDENPSSKTSNATTPDGTVPNPALAVPRPHSSLVASDRPGLDSSSSSPLESVSAPPLSPDPGRPKLTGHSASDNLAADLARQLALKGSDTHERAFSRSIGTRVQVRSSSTSGVDRSSSGSAAGIMLGGVTSQPGWAEDLDPDAPTPASENLGHDVQQDLDDDEDRARLLAGEKAGRRRSFVPPTALHADLGGDSNEQYAVPGGSPGKLGVLGGASNGLESGGARRASFTDSTRKRPAFGSSIWG
ncbi:hypothetical protein JCM10212_001138 [Sporobolomyces blumeae]